MTARVKISLAFERGGVPTARVTGERSREGVKKGTM